MKKALSILLISIILCAAFAGCAGGEPEASPSPTGEDIAAASPSPVPTEAPAEPTAAPTAVPTVAPTPSYSPIPIPKQTPAEPMDAAYTYRRVHTLDNNDKFLRDYFRYDYVPEDITSYIKYAVRCRVEYCEEYAFRKKDSPLGQEYYRNCYVCVVTDPIYGDIKNGTIFTVLDYNNTHNKIGGAYVIEVGKEYIFFLQEDKRAWDDRELIESFIEYYPAETLTFRDREFGIMAVDGDTVTYRRGFGDIGGKAVPGGINRLMGAEEDGLTADYASVKAEAVSLIEAEKAAEAADGFTADMGRTYHMLAGPAEKPVRGINVDYANHKFTVSNVLDRTECAVRIKTTRVQECAFRMYGGYHPWIREYRTYVEGTVIDSIYGDFKAGDRVSFISGSMTYLPIEGAYLFEEDKEYVVVLYSYPDTELSYDYTALSQYYLGNALYTVMPVDESGVVTYDYLYGDMDGKAPVGGERFIYGKGEKKGYTVDYDSFKIMLSAYIKIAKEQ